MGDLVEAPVQGSLEKLTKLMMGLYSFEVLFSDECDTCTEGLRRRNRVTRVQVWLTMLIRRN